MGRRVLVVDDDAPTVALIRIALERAGFTVASASNGAECLLAVDRQRPDLLILDVLMPIMDGFQTLRVLRETPASRHLPVLILTCRREDEDVLEGWQSGADLYLTKPFEIEELATAVKRMLGLEASAG
jgi:two-component system alkaline phosphatase synthesis response regulator PhoP/two-component system response regulator VicR